MLMREKMDLRTKILLLPFTELTFYRDDVFQKLSETRDTNEYNAVFNKTFANRVYPILNQTGQIQNLAEINLLLKSYYAHKTLREGEEHDNQLSLFYLQHLTRLSSFFLTHRDGMITFKYWESKRVREGAAYSEEARLLGPYRGNHKVAMWNSLDRMFTTDVLVILYLLDNQMKDEFYLSSYHSSVSLADPQLEQILSQGVAETHLHLAAGGNFGVIWQKLMSPQENDSKGVFKEQKKEFFSHQVTQGPEELQNYVQAMVLLRVLLAKYLHARALDSDMGRSLEQFYQKATFGDTQDSIIEFLYRIEVGENLAHRVFPYEQWYRVLLGRYNLFPKKGPMPEDWKQRLGQQDAIHQLISPLGDYNTVEVVFLFKALRYMTDDPYSDSLFHKLFWQYLRVKNEVFKLYVEMNHIRGLDYFLGYYSRATKKLDWELSLHQQLENPYLKKLEVRIAPYITKDPSKLATYKQVKSRLAKDVSRLLKAYKGFIDEMEIGRTIPEIGIVVHFLKREDSHGIEKCWLDYDPFEYDRGDRKTVRPLQKTRLYFKHMQDQYRIQMEAIRDFREEIPKLSDYIVGIDAAGAEFATEPWVFAPVFKEARDSKTHKILYPNSRERIRNLGLTFHVGEDFLHLLTGIRRVHEVIDHFQFHAGDRIGHGLALGIQPKQWAVRNPVVVLTRIEYLENLLWVWGIHRYQQALQIDSSTLEHEIMELAMQIYQKISGLTTYDLWRAYQSKFNTFEISQNFERVKEEQQKSELFCPFITNSDQIWDLEKLTHAQHCKCYLEPMMEPIQVEIHPQHIALMEQMQTYVRNLVSRQGIVVETNPTSNVTIGEVENIFLHFIQKMNQRGLHNSFDSDMGMMVTINSDDPVVFNTNINNEYAYIFYSLVDKGYAREDILQWMNHVRELGVRSSFVRDREMTKEERIQEISLIIQGLDAISTKGKT